MLGEVCQTAPAGTSGTNTCPELNPGTNVTWNWEEINKYIKKAETLNKPPQETIDKFHMPIDDAAHGHDGPLQVG